MIFHQWSCMLLSHSLNSCSCFDDNVDGVCACACMHVCVCVCMCSCMFVGVDVSVCLCFCLSVSLSVCLCSHKLAWMWLFSCPCMLSSHCACLCLHLRFSRRISVGCIVVQIYFCFFSLWEHLCVPGSVSMRYSVWNFYAPFVLNIFIHSCFYALD